MMLAKNLKTVLFIVLCAVVFIVSAATILKYREEIKNFSARTFYIVKLPFDIIRMVREPPDRKLVMPVWGVEVENVADTWHAPRDSDRTHEGQDIFAGSGTPVYSATKGYIIFVGQNERGGNILFVLGAGGLRYYYAHLSAFHPEMTFLSYVDTETVIGYVGNTGNAETTPPHLHFGVYDRGTAIDPLPLLYDRQE